MKSFLLIATLNCLFLSALTYNFYTEAWPVNEPKELNDVVITRLSGENTEIGVTNISYDTQNQLFKDLKEKKKSGEFSNDRYNAYLEKYRRKASGGMLHVFITRNDFDEGNMDYFHVKVLDKKGKEMFVKQYPNQIPKTNREQVEFMWKNEGLMMFTPDLYLPITVEITDKSNNKEAKHSFKITAN